MNHRITYCGYLANVVVATARIHGTFATCSRGLKNRRVTDEQYRLARENKLLLLRTRDVESWQISTLIALACDQDAAVRDWATFALAGRADDSEGLRDALVARASDDDFDTRSEAIWGLARRQDERAVPLLIDALEAESVGKLSVEAAGLLARAELVDALEGLRDWWDVDIALLSDALARCRGEQGSAGRIWDILPARG